MSLSQTARLYQLKNGHRMLGTLCHGDAETRFKYGLKNAALGITTYIHGLDGNSKHAVLETVEFLKIQSGDRVKLVDGTKGRVREVSQTVLDEKQLLFMPYDRAEKLTQITIEYL